MTVTAPVRRCGRRLSLDGTERLNTYPGVLDVRSGLPAEDPPLERPEVLRYGRDVPPVDLTIIWESRAHADTLFQNSLLSAEINGAVVGAPAVHIVGQPQAQEVP